jgi:hypothetical protein
LKEKGCVPRYIYSTYIYIYIDIHIHMSHICVYIYLRTECPYTYEVPSTRKSVYLITFPALTAGLPDVVDRAGLRCPSQLTREEIQRCLAEAWAENAAQSRSLNVVDLCVVFQERHAPRPGADVGPVHYHVALKAIASFRFVPVKRVLRAKHGLASHWSTSHDGMWSAIRYGSIPSPTKPQNALDPDPLVWSRREPLPSLFDLAQEPVTAGALKRKREQKVKAAAAAGKQEPKATEMDLYAIIVQQGIRNTRDHCSADDDLIKHLKEYGSPGVMRFAFQIRSRLSALIDDVWSWETVDDRVAISTQTRPQLLRSAAAGACECDGRWRLLAELCFEDNAVDPRSICYDIFASLRDGRREDRPIDNT